VLVIDDEADIREIIELTLVRVAGWRVIAAADGRAGEQLALEHHPDAILLDVMMPGLDGEATARLVRSHAETRDIPIVLLSASDMPPWAEPPELGVRGRVAKPFDPLRLAHQVQEVLAG
jgi:CheY-like chemotaxis protein